MCKFNPLIINLKYINNLMFSLIYKLNLWKITKQKKIKTFAYGTMVYVVLLSFLYSKYIGNESVVMRYRMYIFYVLLIDVLALGWLLLKSNKKKSNLLQNDNRHLPNILHKQCKTNDIPHNLFNQYAHGVNGPYNAPYGPYYTPHTLHHMMQPHGIANAVPQPALNNLNLQNNAITNTNIPQLFGNELNDGTAGAQNIEHNDMQNVKPSGNIQNEIPNRDIQNMKPNGNIQNEIPNRDIQNVEPSGNTQNMKSSGNTQSNGESGNSQREINVVASQDTEIPIYSKK